MKTQITFIKQLKRGVRETKENTKYSFELWFFNCLIRLSSMFRQRYNERTSWVFRRSKLNLRLEIGSNRVIIFTNWPSVIWCSIDPWLRRTWSSHSGWSISKKCHLFRKLGCSAGWLRHRFKVKLLHLGLKSGRMRHPTLTPKRQYAKIVWKAST